jgi:hypothetical protein
MCLVPFGQLLLLFRQIAYGIRVDLFDSMDGSEPRVFISALSVPSVTWCYSPFVTGLKIVSKSCLRVY